MAEEQRNTQVPQTEVQEEAKSDLEQRLLQLDNAESEPEQERSTESTQPPTENELPDLSELDLPEQQPQAEPTAEAAPELPDSPEAKKFAEDFKKYLGFDVTELQTGVKELQQYREQIAQEKAKVDQDRQLDALSKEWGLDRTELDNRMTQVVERFNQYPPEMQQRLDNLEGAKLIWAKIEQEQGQNKVPQFQKSGSRVTTGKKFLFTQSEIANMPNDEYQRNADRIVHAYKQGLVDKSK
jgi:hypothetical protein